MIEFKKNNSFYLLTRLFASDVLFSANKIKFIQVTAMRRFGHVMFWSETRKDCTCSCVEEETRRRALPNSKGNHSTKTDRKQIFVPET